MNKKFLSAILFGALVASSTSTFVSCKDYDDDVNSLQEQIDKNASTVASELASKVTALESQLSTLNAAKEDLAKQLAAAKTEAAAAAANALEAAKGAQGTADAAATALSDAVARMATLETKVGNLETLIAELSTAKNELNNKVSDLQNQITAVKNDTQSNTAAIAAANASILAKTTELSSEISKLSASLGARIDVIDATLNSIQANYATKDELNTKAQELAVMDAQLKNQIEVNLKYIETLQTTVKELAAKDADLAAKIEANYGAVIEKINALVVEQTNAQKQIEALQNATTELKSLYSTLSSAKADLSYVDEVKSGLNKLIENINNTLTILQGTVGTNTQNIEDLRNRVSTLEQKANDLQKLVETNADKADKAVKDAVSSLQEEIKNAAKTADDNLNKAIAEADEKIEANKEEIEIIKEALDSKADQTAVNDIMDGLLNTQSDVIGISDGLRGLRGEIVSNKAELESAIATAEQAAKDYAYDLVSGLDGRVDDIEELLEQLTGIAGEDLSKFITDDELTDKLGSYITDTEFTTAFQEQKDALSEEIETITEGYNTFKTNIEEQIEAELAKLIEVNENLAVLQNDVDILKQHVAALVNRIQSVAFVPQYNDKAGNVITPVYFFNPASGTPVTPTFEVKFRIQPVEAANKLVALYATYPELVYLENSEKLQTRGIASSKFPVTAVYASAEDPDGYIRVVAEPTGLTEGSDISISDELYPATLVIDGTITTDENGESTEDNKYNTYKTSDFFNIRPTDLSIGQKKLIDNVNIESATLSNNTQNNLLTAGQATLSIWYNDFTLYTPAMLKNIVTVNNVTGWNEEEIGHDLILYAVADKNGNAQTNFSHNDVKAASWYRFFDVSANGVQMKKENNVAINNAINQEVNVWLADKAFGKDANGQWNVTYKVTYKAIENVLEADMKDQASLIPWKGIQSSTDEEVETFEYTKDNIKTDVATLAKYGYDKVKLFNELRDLIDSRNQNANTYTKNGYYKVIFSKKNENVIQATLTRLGSAIYGYDVQSLDALFEKNNYFKANFHFDVTFKMWDDFYNKQLIRWDANDQTILSANFNWSDVEAAGKDNKNFVYTIDMATAYLYLNKYTETNFGCIYNFAFDKHVHGNYLYDLDPNTIKFEKHSLKVYGPVEAADGCNVPYSDVRFKLTVKDHNGNIVEEDKIVTNSINLIKPLSKESFNITSGQNLGKLTNGQTVDVAKYVNMVSKVSLTGSEPVNGVIFIKDGKVVSNENKVKGWNVSVKYKAISIKGAGQDITDNNISLDEEGTGKLTVMNTANITSDVTVTIKVTVKYAFDTIEDEYTVIIPAQI